MSRSNFELLRHMIDEIDFILTYTDKKSKDEVINDPILCRAIIRSLEITGEAAKKISDEFKSQYPQVQWKKIAGTRDKLIHEYFGIDYEIIWNIITTKLPDLQEIIQEIIDEGS